MLYLDVRPDRCYTSSLLSNIFNTFQCFYIIIQDEENGITTRIIVTSVQAGLHLLGFILSSFSDAGKEAINRYKVCLLYIGK